MPPRPETNLLICHGMVAPRARWRERMIIVRRLPGPVFNGDSAVVLSVSLSSFFRNEALDVQLHRLRLARGNGVRDPAPFKGRLLVLAGPVTDGGGERHAAFWLGGVGVKPKLLKRPAHYIEGGLQAALHNPADLSVARHKILAEDVRLELELIQAVLDDVT